jgi:actin-related protein
MTVTVVDEKEELEGDVIVIDNGAGFIKAGWAGEDAPRFVIPTVVVEQNKEGVDMEYLIGEDAIQALHEDPNVTVIYPMKRGCVENWKALHQIWDHIFKNCMQVDASQYPVLITVPPMCDKEQQKEMAARLFGKDFNVPALCISNASVLSLFSTGRTTGVVLEVGQDVTYTVPVYEGFPLAHATLKLPLAGRDVTRRLMDILDEHAGIGFTEAQFDIVQDIKEKLCALDLGEEEREEDDADNSTYELPNGQVIHIDDYAKYTCSEILFDPITVTPTSEEDFTRGVAEMIFKTISMCDPELQKELYKNIVLAGGTSMLKGFGERVKREMNEIVSQYDYGVYTEFITDSQRKNSAWIGGSMFASLETFGQIKIKNEEYKADSSIVFKKFFG